MVKKIDINQIGARELLIPQRSDQPELLDQGAGSSADVEANLTEMWRLNRAFGGVSALTRHLFTILKRTEQPLRLVDVGTGSAEMAIYIARWASQNQRDVNMTALDISGRNLAVARKNTAVNSDVQLVQADIRALPFAVNSVDYYISSLFLHHFSPYQIIELLHQLYNSAKRGIIMSDLVRGYTPLLAFRLVEPAFARNYLTRQDGRLSIRRAYTPSELRTLAQAANIPNPVVFTYFPWRMTLVAEKNDV